MEWTELEEYNEATNGLKVAYNEATNEWFVYYQDKEHTFANEADMDDFLESILLSEALDEGTINYI